MRNLFFLLLLVSNIVVAQSLYKTPSGKKYHIGSCRMVKNVSQKVSDDDIARYGLKPCKICRPPFRRVISGKKNKSVGTSQSVQCRGRTKKGTRCRHKTRLANGFCFQHTGQNH